MKIELHVCDFAIDRGGSRIWKRGILGKIFKYISANLRGFLMKLAQKGVGVRPLRPPLDPPPIEYKIKDLVIRY